MTDVSKEILEKYQIRKSKKQKNAFIDFLRAHFPDLRVEDDGKLGLSRNLVIGDVESAKVVLTAHYDTCAVMPVPNFIMPKNPLLSFGYGVLIALPILLIAGGLGALVRNLTQDPGLGSSVYMLSFWFLFVMMLAGPANKHTVNDNTSGVITLIELLSTMTPKERSEVCFVFFDNEELGLLGSAAFAKKHKEVMKDKLLINFDCVSDGDNIMLMLNKLAYPEYADAMKAAFEGVGDKAVLIENSKGTYYPSDQKNFKKNVGAAAFKKSKLGLYMDRIHTPRDTVMDERNIEVLVFGIIKFIGII